MKIKIRKKTKLQAVKLPGIILLLILTIMVSLVAAEIVSLRAQNQKSRDPKADESFPTVDYNAPLPSDPQARSKRSARNGIYDRHKGIVEESPTGSESIVFDDSLVDLPALPVYGSDAIVLGEAGGGKAYLSNDKSGVYSEFTVRVDRVFKDDKENPLLSGGSINVARLGGRVRYSATKSKLYRIAGQSMPQQGRSYIFFLKKGGDRDSYTILTAYELRAGVVHPLDGLNAKSPSPWAGNTYENSDEGSFLNKLQEAVAASPVKP